MPRPIAAQEQFLDLPFPMKGVDMALGFNAQPPGSTPVGDNVRVMETITLRDRGGSRPGLAKYIATAVNGTALIQELQPVVGVGYNAPGSVAASISVLQSAPIAGTGGATSIATTFPGAVTTGSTIVVEVVAADVTSFSGSQPTSVTDNKGNTYTKATEATGGTAGGRSFSSIWYSANVTGGSNFIVTANFASTTGCGITASEVENLTATPLDVVSNNNGSTLPATTGSVTTTQAAEIAFIVGAFFIGINESQSVVLPTGFTQIYSNTASRPSNAGYQILSSTQSLNPSWVSSTNPTSAWACCIATFKATTVSTQPSQSGRVVTLVAVSGGTVKAAAAGATAWTTATSGTTALATTGVIRSAANNQKLWFADGTNWKYYDASDNTVKAWTASAGALPVDGSGNKPRLICTWRGRTVLSGLLEDGQNWFMSAVNDPTDFDYFPSPIVPTQAVAGNNSPLGLIGDVVTALIPYSDDTLIFGGDHTVWMCNGDPMAGGQIDLITDQIGMAWGNPWTKAPDGTLYFVSNRTGIYSMIPGQQPLRVSQQIDQELFDLDTGTNIFRLLWDDFWQGFHVFITPVAAAAPTTHLFYEATKGAWWTDTFASDDHNPLCCCTFDGNLTSDRRTLIGSWDGFVRNFSPDATTDDGTTMTSSVILGPMLTKDFDDVLLKDLQAILATGSGTVTYEVYVGATAEAALVSTAVSTGTWSGGRSLDSPIRRRGHAIYVKLTSTARWAMESIRARVAGRGKVSRRGP